MATISRMADTTADWRQQMAIAELQQALEFDSGERDSIFDNRLDVRPLRHGAIVGCVRTALAYLTNRGATLKQRQQEHDAGVCDELCPWCNPREWD